MAREPETVKNDFWIFGYGQKPYLETTTPLRYIAIPDSQQCKGPTIDVRVPGYIEGYVRRFWQASEDHRGTPESPGRVVTLISDADYAGITKAIPSESQKAGPVWGAAYHVPEEFIQKTSDYLDLREINGYSIHRTTFVPAPSRLEHQIQPIRDVIVYIGLPTNPQFLGYQNPDSIAAVIAKNEGPSGLNRDYLFELEKALEKLSEGSGDQHVSNLVQRVRGLLQEESCGDK